MNDYLVTLIFLLVAVAFVCGSAWYNQSAGQHPPATPNPANMVSMTDLPLHEAQ